MNSNMPNSRWIRFVRNILAPQADEASIQAEIEKARDKAGAPVLWLLGKAQAGKSSVIQGLTGSTAIEIGNGCRACTRSRPVCPTRSHGSVTRNETRRLRAREDHPRHREARPVHPERAHHAPWRGRPRRAGGQASRSRSPCGALQGYATRP